jgi:uncharacterized protein (DUF305 family)
VPRRRGGGRTPRGRHEDDAVKTHAVVAVATLLLELPWAIAACGDDDDTEGLAASSRERAFLAAMVPHQESAVEIARTARSRAKHVEIRELAQAIISTQQLEIHAAARDSSSSRYGV